jgi:uncharacterized protein YecE (DUF72 family)
MHSPARRAARVRVGVAGWDYADWNGIVYPVGSGRAFDRLAYLSRFVDVVEINSTFYRPAAPRVASSWVRRTAHRNEFRFTAKAHRSWTHESQDPTSDRVSATLEGLRPLRDADRLGALLVQFPQSFHDGRRQRERIDRLAEAAEGWPLVIEVRHVSWQSEDVESWFSSRGIGWCLVDQPRVGRSTLGALPRVTGPTAYMRLHGRNRSDWFRADAGRDQRYDYLYPRVQMRTLAQQARRMACRAEQLFVIQNNHFRGQALVNALQMKRLLGGETPRAPQELVATYPQLEAEVVTEYTRLF